MELTVFTRSDFLECTLRRDRPGHQKRRHLRSEDRAFVVVCDRVSLCRPDPHPRTPSVDQDSLRLTDAFASQVLVLSSITAQLPPGFLFNVCLLLVSPEC